MNSAIHLQELVRQVRGYTIELFGEVPEEWLWWTPAGTANHILWHAGHALWVQDVLCVEPLTGRSELPDGDPLKDISSLHKVQVVLQSGRVVHKAK